jgi:hypothetical protein
MSDDQIPRSNPQKRHTRIEWIEKFQRMNCVCYYCGEPLTFETVEKDHLTPVCRGGASTIDNIVPACGPCNRMKSWRTEAEFKAALPILSTRHVCISKPKPSTLPIELLDEPTLLKRLVYEREGRVSWAWRNPNPE